MASIQGCSSFAIRDSQFTIVQGSQRNIKHIHINRLVVRSKRKKKQAAWGEFERIRTGDVYLTSVVDTSDVMNSDHKMVARRTISVARIRGEKEAEFLHVGYSGPGAFKVFKRQLDKFSAVKEPYVAQLSGYNDRHGLPALIFYDELIPLKHILRGNPAIRNILIYFRFQLGVSGMVEGVDRSLDSDVLWIKSSYTPVSHLGLLPIQNYIDTGTVVDYLTRTLPAETILEEVSHQVSLSSEQLTAIEALPYLAGSLSKRNQRNIIARWMGLTEMPHYVCVDCWPPAHRIVMEDGSVRIQFAGSKLAQHPSLFLRYELSHDNKLMNIGKWWLTQAHSVFSRFGIPEKGWEDYSITTSLWLQFHRIEESTCLQMTTDTPSDNPAIYLFIRPIPRFRPSHDETIWRAWAKNTKSFWSFDASGQEKMSKSTRISLGLPSYRTKIELYRHSWDVDHYKLVERLHLSKGFDLKTTDLARSFGYPLMQVVEDRDRFEGLEDSMSSTTIADILGSRSGFNIDNGQLMPEASNPDDEIVVYPRQRK
ncbi:hypothetical protein WG66_001563 [Moniliophthora roreri]|uniref:Uncharacterized protein n=1 Tax=Moniliophthora roreri TaxID=221103 RepID=A0A0W0F658_MONRR|nr:hypothetical protein WG66_001563 [Moniliophthora roreri]